MRNKRIVSIVLGAWAIGAGGVLVHCVGDDTGTTDGGKNDATTDSSSDVVQPPDAGFTLTLAPGHLTEDPGDNVPVTINVNRAAGFNDPVNFTVTPPPGLTTTQPAPAGSSSLFYVSTNADAGAGDYDITVTGSSTSLVQNVKLGVHVGSLLAIGDGGVVSVPQFATVVDVKAWGAGGGAGTGCQNYPDAGAFGGGGGFASAFVPVTGGATYLAFVGTGGAYNPNDCAGGGGGGGYSAFMTADGGVLLVAGGGGGAASIDQYAGYAFGGPGGGGGGIQGGTGGGTCVGFGGTADDGGPAYCGGNPGTYLQGGNAPSSSTSGGTPGGGTGGGGTPSYGNGAPGGGGGGYYGGGSGGIYGTGTTSCPPYQPCASGGGGGGAGYNPFDGGVLNGADASAPPNTSDPDYVSGVAAGGAHAAGGPGRVIIRLPKP